MEKAIEVLSKLQIKITEPRKVITSIMINTKQHLTIEDILKQAKESLPQIGIATVYRVLKILEDEKVIEKHIFNDDYIIYENTYAKDHHYHIIDIEKNNVIEFCNSDLEELIKKLVSDKGYELISHNIKIYAKGEKNDK
ncbi:MAG: transcriptional repressor [Alphaproteobacteria bacterium]|jgi:Fur family ferric uptake transcriptional regulator|nr:transcriptional repressor [Alphaproteobacteria bacterium]